MPTLTLNLGLRYEFMSPNYEQAGKFYNFDPANNRLIAAGNGTDVNSTAPGHVYSIHFMGCNSLSDRSLVDFAYQVSPKAVVRGDYGISYAYLFRMGGDGLRLPTMD